jgi:hypothetical protein
MPAWRHHHTRQHVAGACTAENPCSPCSATPIYSTHCCWCPLPVFLAFSPRQLKTLVIHAVLTFRIWLFGWLLAHLLQAEARARTDFYTSERTAGVLDGSLLASQAAVAAARKAKGTQGASSPSTTNASAPAPPAATDDGSTSGTGSTSSVSSTGSTSSSTGSTKDVVWSDLPLLNHEVGQ